MTFGLAIMMMILDLPETLEEITDQQDPKKLTANYFFKI